jgi:hypothetical protein
VTNQLSKADQHRLQAPASAASRHIAVGEACPKTGREYERGHGALPKEEQTANFLREGRA